MNGTFKWTCEELREEKIRKMKNDEFSPIAAVLFFIFLIFVFVTSIMNCIANRKRSRRVGPISKTPAVPFSQNGLAVDTGDFEEKFYCGFPSGKDPTINGELVTSKLRKILKIVHGLPKNLNQEPYVPPNVRIISIKMDGFKHGELCHDFIPIDGMAEGSYFTYQEFGTNAMQVISYVENDVSYLAGICFYIETPYMTSSSLRMELVKNVIKYPRLFRTSEVRTTVRADHPKISSRRNAQSSTAATPEESTGNIAMRHLLPQGPSRKSVIRTEQWAVSYCEKLKRDVMTTRKSEDVIHREWNHVLNKMTSHTCHNCTGSRGDLPPTYSSLSIV